MPTTERRPMSISEFAAEIHDLDGTSEHINAMAYGDSGCGKTVLAGTCPDSLILACEPGYIAAANTNLGLPVGKRQLRLVNDTATANAALDYLESGNNARRYQWVVAEGMTTLETKVRLGYAAEAFDANPTKRAHRNLPDKPDYFNTQNFIRSWVARLVDLPVNVLITAHAMRLDDDSGDRLVLPAFQQREGALSNYVSGLMHVVGFMRKRAVKNPKNPEQTREVRRILFQQRVDPNTGTIYFAKDQFNALPRSLDDTNMQTILGYIQGEEKPAPRTKRTARR